MICNFKKYYKENNRKKYNLFVISIFYYNKYLKLGKKGIYSNLSIEKQLLFIKNIKENVKKLYNGFIPDDWKIRIYFDKTLFKFKYNEKFLWKELFMEIKDLDKIQLISYNCPKYFNSETKSHKKLFGTLIRFYSLFEKNDNIKSINLIDADNTLTKPWLNELINFINSEYDINVFCSKYEFARYKTLNKNNNFNCYFRAGIFSSKVLFEENEWNKIFNEIEDNKSEFIKVYDKIINNLNILFPDDLKNKNDTFFEFGFDEIILNHFIKNIIKKNNYKVKYVYYQPSLNIFLDYLMIYLKFKDNNNYTIQLLNNGNYNNLNDFYNDYLISIKKKIFFEKLNFLKKNLYILDKMNINYTLLDFIKYENKKTFYKYKPFFYYLN